VDLFGRRKKIWGGKRQPNSKNRLGQRSLELEALETRHLLTVTLNPIVGYDANSSFLVPTGRDLFVPLTASDPGDTITYTVTSSNPGITGNVLAGNPTLKLQVSGTDNNDQAFSGVITIELFEDFAPETVDTIIDLVNSGFYNDTSFYRIIPDFMIQGGANGSDPVDKFDDEFDPALTFNSPGLLAMANPGTPDSNTSEFFVTDIDQALAAMPQYLNFQHTIFGQLTSGQDLYQKIMNAKGITGSNSSPSTPVRIVSAEIIDDTQNGVLQLTGANNFVGTSTISVTAHSTDGTTATRTFTVNMAKQTTPTEKQPLILAPVQNLTTETGTAISFDVTSTRLAGVTGTLTFNVKDPNSFEGAPSNVTVQVTPTGANSARITLTPAAGFKGTIDLMATLDNASGNLADTQTFSLTVQDEVEVAITGITDPINASNAGNTSISGTGNAGDTITVVVSNGNEETQEYTTTVNSNNQWSISGINVTSLDDGTLTYTVTAEDDDGNTAEDTREVEKDTQIPPLAITGFTAQINNTNKTQVTVSGTGEADTTITVVLSDGENETQEYTVKVGSNGTWSISNINATSLADGEILIIVTAEDEAGNSIERTAEAEKDVDAPDLDIVDVTDPITIANVTETSIRGTGEAGATITVVVTDGTRTTTEYTTTVGTNGQWRIDDIDVSELADGDITYRVKAKDEAGNETQDTITAEKTVVAITIVTDPVNSENEDETSASGTGQPGATVTLVVSDGENETQEYTTTIGANGQWSIDGIDVSMLDDGTLTYTVTAEDEEGNTATQSREVTKDTVAPDVEIDDATDPVNGDNQDEASISGTGEAGSTITVVVTDGDNTTEEYTTTVNAQGKWTITGIDLSDLDDGTITYRVTATDTAGNESEVVTLEAEKDTEAPELDIEDVTDPINIGNSDEVTASGTGEPGATISIVVTDGTKTTAAVTTTVDEEGNWEIEGIDISELADGTVTFRVTATDEAGNKTEKTQTATKRTVHVTVVTDPVNSENEDSITVSGTGQVGATVRVTVTDGDNTTQVYTTTIGSNGTWSISNIDVSMLDDGTLTVTAVAEDDNENEATSTKTTTKDTDAPDVAITSVTDPINGSNSSNVSASGTGEAGATITLTVTDGDNTTTTYTTTVGSNGTWTINGINVSSLDDGTLTFRVTAKDAANNTAEATRTSTKTVTSNGSLSGVAYVDLNGNGTRDNNEPLLAGVIITLAGVDGSGNPLPSRTVITGADGTYTFGDLAPGTYSLTQAQPTTLVGGGSTAGNLGGTANTNSITGIEVGSGESGTNYNFREGGLHLSMISLRLFLASTPPASELYSKIVADYGVTAPLVMSITKLDADDSTGSTVRYTVTFNEDVTGVNASDFTILGGTGATIASVTGSGKTYTVTVNVGTGGGPISLKLADNDSIKSAKNVALGGTGEGNGDFIGPAYSLSDTTDPNVTIGSVTNPINADNEDEVTASGTGDPGDKITLVVSNGSDKTQEYTTTVGSNGTWTINGIDVSDLDDGTLTFTVTAKDDAGNTKTATKTALKDTVAPELEIEEVTDPINNQNEEEVEISGTAEPNATITVVATDGENESEEYTIKADGQGNWKITGIDVSMLDDGTITFKVIAKDDAGNATEDEIEAVKDTEAPEVEIEEATDPLTIANHKNATISGTAEPNAKITVTVTDGTNTTQEYTTEADAQGNWEIEGIDTSNLADGTVTYTVTAEDEVGNTATDTKTAAKKTVAVTSVTDPINAENQDDVSISGTGEPGAAITVVVTDGENETEEYTTEIGEDGTWSISGIDVSELDDGELTFKVKATDDDGNFAETEKKAQKDTVAPEGEVTSVTNPINIENQGEVTASGTGEPGAIVKLIVTRGEGETEEYTTEVGEDGTWSISGIDVSELEDGTLTFKVTFSDAAGNTTESTIEAEKDTEVPAIDIDELSDPITIALHKSVTLSGTGEPGSTITVVVTDGTNSTEEYTVEVDGEGNWTIEGIDTSSLKDGELTFNVTAEDEAGNTATASINVTKRTVAINSIGLIGPDNADDLTVTGTGQPHATITLVVTNGAGESQEYTAEIGEDGTWTIEGIDVSELDDGNLTFTVTAEDGEGNTAVATAVGVKDTTAPQIVVNGFTNTINSNTDDDVTASGTGEVGAIVKLRVTDGTNHTQEYTTEVGEDGTWSISGIDVSELEDGELTFEVTASDEAGNVSEVVTQTANKDATPPALAINQPGETVGIGETEDTTASGTGEIGATVKVVVSDGTNHTEEYTTEVDEEGNWSIDGIDVSELLDGTLTYTATAVDAAGNSSVAAKTVTKRTVAITTITDPIDEENETDLTVSGTGQAGATIKLVVSDGTDETEEYTTTVDNDGNWSIDGVDVSALDDGHLTFTATATAGTATAEATRIALKDTGETELTVEEFTETINDENKGEVTISGTGEDGATVKVVVTDGENSTQEYTATVDEEGNWSIEDIDVSGLDDGEVTFKVTIVDGDGNEAYATATATKDTEIEGEITAVTSEINGDNETEVTASGTGEVGAIVTLIVSDGEDETTSYTATVGEDGTWEIVGIDVSELADGVLTFTVSVEDEAGNTITDTMTANKDTSEEEDAEPASAVDQAFAEEDDWL